MVNLGSPPQVRGKLAVSGFFAAPVGITPAGAGKTLCRDRLCPTCKDHPRRCGENITPVAPASCPKGSPPQVRGKLISYDVDRGDYGITPAGAGKTQLPRLQELMLKDHPRRCGENHQRTHGCRCGQGSPPQVRGKRTAVDFDGGSIRITPAGAGKT